MSNEAKLKHRIALLEAALEPFSSFADGFVDSDGWNGPMTKTRIIDWFGPSDFRKAQEASNPFVGVNIILLGPPGSGKGTQSKYLVKHGMKQLSTGDMLRAEMAAASTIGQEIISGMASGQLIPDEIVNSLIEQALASIPSNTGVIFDGYPRAEAQAIVLSDLLQQMDREIDFVVELKVDEAELIRRVSGRYSCSRCQEGYHDVFKLPERAGICDICGSGEFVRRNDDKTEILAERMIRYREKTQPVLSFYEKKGLVRRINGMATIEEVSQQINDLVRGII